MRLKWIAAGLGVAVTAAATGIAVVQADAPNAKPADEGTGSTHPVTLLEVENDGAAVTVGVKLEIPEAVRDEVPANSAVEIQVVETDRSAGVTGIYGQTTEPLDTVALFYTSALVDAGWTEVRTSLNPAKRMWEFEKGKRYMTLMLLPDRVGVDVVIEVRNKPGA
ncbi:MAG: hypothetical protein AMXMBFR84_48070 [Candidatus Hydrogenedentota bacterium]